MLHKQKILSLKAKILSTTIVTVCGHESFICDRSSGDAEGSEREFMLSLCSLKKASFSCNLCGDFIRRVGPKRTQSSHTLLAPMRIILSIKSHIKCIEKQQTQIEQEAQALKIEKRNIKAQVLTVNSQQPDEFKVFFLSSVVVSSFLLMNFRFVCSQMCRSCIVDSTLVFFFCLLHLRFRIMKTQNH